MQAVICTKYGPPEVLQLTEIAKPAPKDNEVLIKIHATAVTASDTIVRGFKLPRWSPIGFMMGLVIGFRKPRQAILGMVLAGEVEAIGKDVQRFQVGDQIYGATFKPPSGIRFGAYAEYTCLPEDSLIVPKPTNITYEEAVAVSYGAGLAFHFLKKGNIRSGQKILIYGASGSIGTLAVQLAKHYGAEVTGVCSTRNLELVKSLGADHVLDYTAQDAPPEDARYDFVLDAVGKAKSSAFKVQAKKALTPDGKYISVDEGTPRHDLEDFLLLSQLLEAGQVKPVIDRTYPLEQIVEAHRYVDTGHKKGCVVITISEDKDVLT